MYFRRGIEKQTFKEKSILFGYAGVLFGFSISTAFDFLALLSFPTTIVGQLFYTDFSTWPFFSAFFAKLADYFYYIGVFVCIIVYETNSKRTRYMVSLTLLIILCITFLIPINTILYSNIMTFIFLYGGIVFLLILIRYTQHSQLESKVYASYILLGIVLTSLVFSMYQNLEGLSFYIPIIPIITGLAGLVFLFPLFVSPKNYISTLKSWSWMTLIVVIIQAAWVTQLFIIIRTSIVYIGISFLVIFIIVRFIVLRHLKQFFKSTIIKTEKEGSPNILGVFTRPERITEKEVAVSKERKICLVCKGTGLRFTYICPECNTIYCQKCARTLSEMENACWVCNIPFDEAKPVNLPEEFAEEAIVKEDIEEKRKN